MSGEFGPGEVYNRRVTKHLQTLLPAVARPGDSYSFGGRTVLDDETNPGKPAGGTCQIKAYVGVDGQITVLEKSELRSGDDLLWASRNVIRRTREVGGAEMEPFRYQVLTKIRSRDSTKGTRTAIDLSEFTSKPIYGGREAQAAVLLAERVASEKATPGDGSCCSFRDLPSFPRVVGKGWLGLDWQAVNDLLGPDADTIAATVSIESVEPAEQEAAASKGVEIFTPPQKPSVDDAVGDRSPGNDLVPHPWETSKDDGVQTELPDDVNPSEAERKILEMIERIRRMKSRE